MDRVLKIEPAEADVTSTSAFHRGERAVQTLVGVRDMAEDLGHRMIRDHMPDQHRAFFGQLPFLVIGAADADGRPWATLVAGQPGFVTSPTDTRLDVAARPSAGDPVGAALADGAEIGLLGIELHSRRRNRMNGKVARLGPSGFSIDVDQSFGNCPQYIQLRQWTEAAGDAPPMARVVHDGDRLDATDEALIAGADTLFLASRSGAGAGRRFDGVDASHRGGKPGFVRVEDGRVLTLPDFAGNNMFNTFGNLVLDPRVGVVFINFETGTMLQITGRAEMIWDGPEVEAFVGAERLVRIEIDRVVRRENALPFTFDYLEPSPLNARTGDWDQTRETLEAIAERDTWRAVEVVAIEDESTTIRSFYLKCPDGRALVPSRPGQYLTLRLPDPDGGKPLVRTYTISDAPTPDHYRISVKREADGTVSKRLHDTVRVGDRIEVLAPRGHFVLDEESERPVVLLSAGVGITPMVAMANHLVKEGVRTRSFRPVWFVHAARDGAQQAFGTHLAELSRLAPDFKLAVVLSNPRPGEDELGKTHSAEGRIDVDFLKRILPFDGYDFYVCGPEGFMASLVQGLIDLGVPPDRVRYEAFGPSSFTPRLPGVEAPPAEPIAETDVPVVFTESGKTAVWTPEAGSLLDLAESVGLTPEYGCRAGSCGTCVARLAEGSIAYAGRPDAATGDGEILLCQARPHAAHDHNGERLAVAI